MAATAASSPAPQPQHNGQAAFSPIVDTRMLTTPRAFAGKDEDCPQSSTVMRAYCGALDPDLLNETTRAETAAGPVDHDGMNPMEDRRSCSLYCILAMIM